MARSYLGYVALQKGDLWKAQEVFEQVVAEAPAEEAGEALVGLARVHQAQRNFGQAAHYYRKADQETGSGMLLGALIKVYLQRFFWFIIGGLLGVMAILLWRYLRVKPPEPMPQPS
jgi:tetratricopeptide (TPR) repeat protein